MKVKNNLFFEQWKYLYAMALNQLLKKATGCLKTKCSRRKEDFGTEK